jgi:ATP-dependent Clp protease adaptor protein ClpS
MPSARDDDEADVATVPDEGVAVEVEEQADAETTTRTRRQPPYAVILHNDNVNTFDFVISVLMKVFRYKLLRAFRLTMQAHHRGRSVVWTGALEVAELKAEQVKACGPDPTRRASGALPLRVTVEPLPGE